MADKLAKHAATISRMCKYGEQRYIQYNMVKNPIQVDIAKDLIRLRRIRKKNRHFQMMNIYNDWKQSIDDDEDEENRYIGDGIFIRSIVNFDYKINNRTNEMKKELEFLTKRECSIIMKLRSEYVNLNHYLHHINYHADGMCDHCNVAETVTHFLMDCYGYKKSVELSLHKDNVDFTIPRCKMRKKLKRIAIFFKYEQNFNVNNILFPHTWLKDPNKNEENWYEIRKKNLEKRVEILKTVITFVDETKRFKNLSL